MPQKHSLSYRVIVAKTLGFFIGGLVFFLLRALGAEFSLEFGLGLWLMYVLMAVMIGFMGIFVVHPVVNMKLPFWIRGGTVGFSFHLMLIFLAYAELQNIMQLSAFAWTGFSSPYWMLIDGTALGILVSWLLTKCIGEGQLPIK